MVVLAEEDGMKARSAGYRLLGRGFDYLLHLRPAEWPIMAVHFLTGSALAIGLSGILEGEGAPPSGSARSRCDRDQRRHPRAQLRIRPG